MKQYTNDYIEKAITRESKISYDIPNHEREDAKGAWQFARTTKCDFNVHLSFTFEFDVNKKATSVRHVRRVAHKLRMWFRTKGIPSNILWTRFVAANSNVEQVSILVHVPEKDFENFKTVVHGWNLGILIEPATYNSDKVFDGRLWSVFDIMFRAVSNETRAKHLAVLAETSEPMTGPRFFYSVKLWIKARRRHKIITSAKTTEEIEAVLKKYLLGDYYKENTKKGNTHE